MNNLTDLDVLFDEATGANLNKQISHKKYSQSILKTASEKLDNLLNKNFLALLQSVVEFDNKKALAFRVDGQIIGTGEADFTKGNTLYTLNYKDKTFQLIDVPGIEGDENKYAHMVQEAVAKAHLVFYINGTNKKPERATAEKIHSYLHRGTQVCPLANIRGNADAYEFDGDRESLEKNSGAGNALKQTMGVLESVLGKEVLLSGHCVQGLLAFSSLAINSENGKTSIHPSRGHDLEIQQRNYLKHFAAPKAMYEFSQIREVAKVLHAKLGSFREDIIESNKTKVRESLIENIGILQLALNEHQAFIARVKPEFEKCRESINGALKTFERLITSGRQNLWSQFFNELTEKAEAIVAKNFGKKETITNEIKKTYESLQESMESSLNTQINEHIESLQNNLSQAMTRLVQDIRRVEFQQLINFNKDENKASYHPAALNMDLSLKDWGSITLNIGSYAATGFAIGSVFPVIGNLIGAAVGVLVGAFVSIIQVFTSKEERIRKAQAIVQKKMDEIRNKIEKGLPDEIKKLMESVRKETEKNTLGEIDIIYTSLTRPLEIIEQQILLMTHIKNQLEKMSHGTIQKIQR